ncbi:MAG TPA: MBOAT family O-acyltransferase [Rhodospirillales bacterium]|jgi:D-alanyl-lipoteichoic acid acyltransferase DltB (MBOAT superfamily)|nr:MBOAT family O-acyltransferase [Rhodospirillales bacterium]
MIFNSEVFILFAAIFFAVYFVLPYRPQLLLTLAASYVFYAWWDWRFCALIAASTAFNFAAGTVIGRHSLSRAGRWLLGTAVAVNLAVLGFFKYFHFFADGFVALLNDLGLQASESTLRIILPIGISFYTFHSLSYVIDIYRGRIRPEPDPAVFATYIALWPQLVAGPIVRASRLIPQLKTRKSFSFPRLLVGCELVIVGFFLKCVVADRLAPITDSVFAAPSAFNGLNVLIGAIFFGFQIYGDFCGYSLIAIGLARIMGLNLGRNFRRPYFASSFSEFWQRWHISLSGWLRDYLYVPLGGNRGSKLATFRNLFATMLLGGLWHGAAWTFVLWGGLHGLYLVLQRLLAPVHDLVSARGALARRGIVGLEMAGVLTAVFAAWVFFRAGSSEAAWLVFAQMVSGGYDFAAVQNKFQVVMGMGLIGLLVAAEATAEQPALRNGFRRARAARVTMAISLLCLLALFGNFTGSQFIYFQF